VLTTSNTQPLLYKCWMRNKSDFDSGSLIEDSSLTYTIIQRIKLPVKTSSSHVLLSVNPDFNQTDTCTIFQLNSQLLDFKKIGWAIGVLSCVKTYSRKYFNRPTCLPRLVQRLLYTATALMTGDHCAKQCR